jgi:xylulokinase
MQYVIGIDVGTNSARAALFDGAGRLIDLHNRAYPLHYPRAGWVEQDPEDWWSALKECVRAVVVRNHCRNQVAALSLSTQGGPLLLLDAEYRPIRPAVSWLDTRAAETAEELKRIVPPADLYRSTGWSFYQGLSFPAVFWFSRKEPATLGKARYIGSAISYLNFRLSGRFATDPSNLALDEFLDMGKKGIWQRAVQTAGLSPDQLPEVVDSGVPLGELTSRAAAELGLEKAPLLVSGAHDQYCASLGAGAVRSGECVLSAGTAWALLATCGRLHFGSGPGSGRRDAGYDTGSSGPGPGSRTESGGRTGSGSRTDSGGSSEFAEVHPGVHPLPGKYGLMTSVPFGGNSLSWFRQAMRPESSFEELDREAEGVKPGSDGLMFVPVSCSGTGKGAFIDIEGVHGFAQFLRAIYEGVALANRSRLDLMNKTGVEVTNLIMIGGGAASRVWPAIVADTTGLPVTVPGMREAACGGAAVLAGAGSGIFPSAGEAAARISDDGSTVHPEPERQEQYEGLFERHRERAEHV